MEDFNCKNCGHSLEWEDVINREGGIQEGYIIESQIWYCPCCNKNYEIDKKAYFTENDIDIIGIREA